MQPAILPGLQHARELPCMIVRSGTSRLVTVLGDHVPVRPQQRDPLLLQLMLGDDETPGLGGEGYQSNKVCVVRRTSGVAASASGSADKTQRAQQAFRFHFFQLLRETRTVRDDMECSNAATAAGVHMMSSLLAQPGTDGTLHTLNEATGQEVVLVPPSRAHPWKGAWRIRFLLAPSVQASMRAAREHTVTVAGACVRFSVVRHGNVFMFAQIAPDAVNRDVSQLLAQAAVQAASDDGVAPPGAWDPKVICYERTAQDAARTACWYVGERHHSMPGSAAMALGLFLEASTLAIQTPGPVITVHAAADGRYTEYDTPVRLLMHGAAALPQGVH